MNKMPYSRLMTKFIRTDRLKQVAHSLLRNTRKCTYSDLNNETVNNQKKQEIKGQTDSGVDFDLEDNDFVEFGNTNKNSTQTETLNNLKVDNVSSIANNTKTQQTQPQPSIHRLIAEGEDLIITSGSKESKREMFLGFSGIVGNAKKLNKGQSGQNVTGLVICDNSQNVNENFRLLLKLKSDEDKIFINKLLDLDITSGSIKSLNERADIVVATTSSLINGLEKNAICIDQVKALLVTDLDQIEQSNSIEDLKRILSIIRSPGSNLDSMVDNQIVFQYSKEPENLKELISTYMQPECQIVDDQNLNPISGKNSPSHYYILFKNDSIKHSAVKDIVYSQLKPGESCIVFVDHPQDLERLNRFSRLSYNCAELSNSTHDDDRDAIIKKFISKEIDCLLVTDTVAHDVDLPSADMIVMLKSPYSSDKYSSRISSLKSNGRVITLITPEQLNAYKWNIKDIKAECKPTYVASSEELLKMRLNDVCAQVSQIDSQQLTNSKALANDLISTYGPEKTIKNLLAREFFKYHSSRSRSVVTGVKGYTCFIIESINESDTFEKIQITLESIIGNEKEGFVGDIYGLKNGKGLVVDVEESRAEEFKNKVSAIDNIRLSFPDSSIEVNFSEHVDKQEKKRGAQDNRNPRVYDYKKLVIRRMPETIDFHEILELFKSPKPMKFKIFIKSDPEFKTKTAFISFNTEEDCETAKQAVSGTKINNFVVKPDYAFKRIEKSQT